MAENQANVPQVSPFGALDPIEVKILIGELVITQHALRRDLALLGKEFQDLRKRYDELGPELLGENDSAPHKKG